MYLKIINAGGGNSLNYSELRDFANSFFNIYNETVRQYFFLRKEMLSFFCKYSSLRGAIAPKQTRKKNWIVSSFLLAMTTLKIERMKKHRHCEGQ